MELKPFVSSMVELCVREVWLGLGVSAGMCVLFPDCVGFVYVFDEYCLCVDVPALT